MGGTNSSSSSQQNSNSNSGRSGSSNATGGRERAIEALIDREPQGDYYRAARVIDEAVPIAHASRPNLITKSALVEQAFALSRYDIDSLSKYDELYLKISEQEPQHLPSNNESRKIDALQKERIFHYHTQVLASKIAASCQSKAAPIISSPREADVSLKQSSTSNADKPSAVSLSTSNAPNVAPSPNLVATLRRMFEGTDVDESFEEPPLSHESVKLNIDTITPITISDSGAMPSRFELRNLLQVIANHSIFTSSVASLAAAVAAQHDHVAMAAINRVDNEQINLEKMIMNITKQLTSKIEEADKESSIQGLMIIIISLLITSQSNVRYSPVDEQKKKDQSGESKTPGSNVQERQETDLPLQMTLQVGPLLSLLSLESMNTSCAASSGSSTIDDTATDDASIHRLNPELLDYFASAAAVYQERLEIRKARRLARMQSPSELLTRSDTNPQNLSKQKGLLSTSNDFAEQRNSIKEQQESDQPRSGSTVETPTAGDRGAPDMEFSIRTEDDDNILMTPTNNNSVTPISSACENRSVEPPATTNSEAMTISDREDQEVLSNDHAKDASDNETNDDQGDFDGDAVVPYSTAGEIQGNMSRNAFEQPDEDDDVEEDEDDEEDPSSSSGSESSEDNDEEKLGDSDDADAVDTDDEDTVLRRAMAMSMVEHEEVEAKGPDEVNPIIQTQQKIENDAIKASLPQEAGSDNLSYEEDDDDANLPPLPNPPVSYKSLLPQECSISIFAPESIKPDTETLSPASQLDPSKLSEFGSIPSCYILFYLLRYTKLELNRRLSTHAKVRSTKVVVSGGVGSSLFSSSAEQATSCANVNKQCAVTLQLIVASCLLMIEHRNETIENLRKSIAKEQRIVHDGTYDAEDENSDVIVDDESSRLPLSMSGEEDDPALTLAMNYVDDDAALSSESLETKGMTRKAAAAAYDAAVLMKSLRKSTNRWKCEVQLSSMFVECSLQILRLYLQAMVRQYFLSTNLAKECSSCVSVADFHTCLPESVKAKLSQGLSSLMSIGTQSSLLAMMSGDAMETERLFQSCNLYKSAMVVWGECIPLMHCSDLARSTLLRSLINGCSGFDKRLPHLISLEKLHNFPNSDVETQFYKVCKVCCRLRVDDLLNGLVSRPLHFVADMTLDGTCDDKYAAESKQSARSLTALLTLLFNSIESLVGDHSEVKFLYLALCHRCQSRALLLDGFYLETETELDDRHNLYATSKTLSTGDTVRVAAGPSASLQFDATKCSDSIAVYTGQDDDSRVGGSGIYSVHQRASKVWGTVLSTKQYSPKTGVHRWAVRLDKCERGHVFIGVATSQSNLKTYVGGDKHGWGMIGTQALWHERRKIRGDYGATFRTGSTIIVTLDTDAGTLGFSSWKDATVSSSLSVDPLLQNIVSPRKGGQSGGVVEDWGIAFEGLPLDAKLYPAVALYQRDDRVTFLTVESPSASRVAHGSSDIVGGRCYYPLLRASSQKVPIYTFASNVRQHNDLLTWDGICYATSTLEQAVAHIRNNDTSNFILSSILPSLGASLCMFPPSVPVLSARFASYLMPYVSKCILELDRYLIDNKRYKAGIFGDSIMMGHWIVRTKSFDDSSSQYEEYEMDITKIKADNESTYFGGKYVAGISGKSKSASGSVTGCVNGSSLTYIEDWYSATGDEASASREPDSYVVNARLSIDGEGFEGTYRSTSTGVSGQIAGRVSRKESSAEAKFVGESSLCACAALLCSAQSHLAIILGDAASGDLDYFSEDLQCTTMEEREKQVTLKAALCGPLLSNSSLRRGESEIKDDISKLLSRYCPSSHRDETAIEVPALNILNDLDNFVQDVGGWHDSTVTTHELFAKVSSVDILLTRTCGGLGSFSGLCPALYSDARKQIICSVLHHSFFDKTWSTDPAAWSHEFATRLQLVWRNALKILEDGVRKALSSTDSISARDKCSDTCRLYSKISSFLLSLVVRRALPDSTLFVQEVSAEMSSFYGLVGNENDLKLLESEMVLATKRSLLRYSSLREVVRIVSLLNIDSMPLIESLTVGLPRQLGRGKVERNQIWRNVVDDNSNCESMPYLDGTYLFRLDGSDDKVIAALRKLVICLFVNLGRISEQAISQQSAVICLSKFDSLMLSILAAFISHFRQEDFDDIITDSRLLVFLPKILAMNRYSILQINEVEFFEAASPPMLLERICQRDVARAILRCSVALVHVVSYQGIIDEKASSSFCIDLVLNELECVFPLIEQDSLRMFREDLNYRSENDWQYFITAKESGDNIESIRPSGNHYLSGLRFLELHGSLLTTLSHGSNTKSPLSHKSAIGGPARHGLDSNHSTSFAQQLLSHWVHVLCSILRSTESIKYILTHPQGLSMLLKQVGLNVEHLPVETVYHTGKLSSVDLGIPGRFRSRLLRLILPLVTSTKASESLVRDLFLNVGISFSRLTQYNDSESWMVSREIVSLLRHLYSPSHPQWKECIDEVISTQANESYSGTSQLVRTGIFSFISGEMGTISRGSYVLIKPTAASALSNETQPGPGGKSHLNAVGSSSLSSNGVGSTPHHLVGNGTNGVITGLCSEEASAGIVSNIDLKNGSCEVILVARNQQQDGDQRSSSELKNFKSTSHGRGIVGGRHTLTVRAVRTALSDVVHAPEVSLCLENSESIESLLAVFLPLALDRLISSRPVDEPLSEATDLMILRCCIVLWSHKKVFSNFASRPLSSSILFKLLEIAWPQDSNDGIVRGEMLRRQIRSVSLLNNHEARFSYIHGLIKDLKLRMLAMNETSESEKETRLKKLYMTNFVDRADMSSTTDAHVRTSELQNCSEIPSVRNVVSSTVRENETSTGRSISHSSAASTVEDEEESSEATSAAVAHLREAAIVQMAELGLPRSWSEYALRRTGGVNIEAAVTFCLERGPEIERMIAEDQEHVRMSSGSVRRRGNRDNGLSSRLLRQLLEMGFPRRWCSEALSVTGNNVDEALTWILSNGERLSEEDEAIETGGENDETNENDSESIDEEDDDEEEDEGEGDDAAGGDDNEVSTRFEVGVSNSSNADTKVIPCWSGSITPLSFISGRAIIDPDNMEISGLPAGGFSSVGTKGILLCSGKWYYEAILKTAGCLQIGWADGSFAGHCHAERGDGCGDGPSSWAFDGWRRYKWHATATEWGCRWKEGDVVGCLVDMDSRCISFTLNGEGENIGMGVAFSAEGFRPCGGVYACVSFNRKEKLRLILGGSGSEPFKHQPPAGYRGVGEAVLEAVGEYESLLLKERVLDFNRKMGADEVEKKRFLCDYSDADHGHELTAWAHRYYGSDASVHLGSGRLKQNASKNSSNFCASDQLYSPYLTRRLQREWKKASSQKSESPSVSSYADVASGIFDGYNTVQKLLEAALGSECATIGCLLARKLLLHLLITSGQDFDLAMFMKEDEDATDVALRFWNVVETCTTLRNAGWVGEAGAMAIAAEALGLCISSNDQSQLRSNSDRRGVVVAHDLDENLQLPVGGYSQLLTSVVIPKVNHLKAMPTCNFKSATAEAAMGSEGGSGILAFLQEGLQAAAFKSKEFRNVIVAKIRRSVRNLAVVEYENDDNEVVGKQEGDDDAEAAIFDSTTNHNDGSDAEAFFAADARLICFCSGMLLSRLFYSIDDFQRIQQDLFEAWSVGLLSASLPWRMICAFTTAGILNQNQKVFLPSLQGRPTVERYFGRLQSTVNRRLWAERAAVPVCSRYAQSLVELLTSVSRAVNGEVALPGEFRKLWEEIQVDSATPIPLCSIADADTVNWESAEGWVSSDSGWEVWTGVVEVMPINWKAPSRSNVRSLMDGGDGPPLVDKGSIVMRGVNWGQLGNEHSDDDGKFLYDTEKANREKEKSITHKSQQVNDESNIDTDSNNPKSVDDPSGTVVPDPADESESAGILHAYNEINEEMLQGESKSLPGIQPVDSSTEEKKPTKLPSPRLPVGTVVSIEPWNGIPGMARRVKWHLTGKEGLYRFGGDGGMYDLCHIEVNSKETKVKKRYPIPESSEQCAARHGFGNKHTYGIILRIRRSGKECTIDNRVEYEHDGVLEWPDFGAGVRVKCIRHACGTLTIEENELLFGSKDSGWMPRFGEPSYIPGSRFLLSVIKNESRESSNTSLLYEELSGGTEFTVKVLRNPADGSHMKIRSNMRLYRGRPTNVPATSKLSLSTSPLPPPITFDRNYCASSLTLSRDNRTVACTSSDSGRGTVFGALGFTKGVHYWEVKLEQADIGSVFIGVAEKPVGSGSGSSYLFDTPPRLNRWHGWGFVNFRATYAAGAERVYGSHCHAGDTVGVLLDCDSGRVSFFFDGLKYGEHIMNDLGCAFENLSPFGFNVDGCGSGGAGQGAPNGFENGSNNRFPAQGTIRPRTLWPVIGLRNHGDRVTISSKWSTSFGTDGVVSTRNIVKVDDVLNAYYDSIPRGLEDPMFPGWFMYEAYSEYNRWISDSWIRSATRGSGPSRDTGSCLHVDLDASPLACAAASAALGLKEALLAGDRVKLTRSAGRILQLDEEAVVLGNYCGRLYYRIVSQKSEGGSLTEGGGRAWYWDESELVEGLPFVLPSKGCGVPLPPLARFCCKTSLKVVYESGAVLRSDLEIFDGSETVGTIPFGTIIPCNTILDRRINSCGGVRFRIRSETFGEGWISERIRGGSEELIVEYIYDADDPDTSAHTKCYETPLECATVWFDSWKECSNGKSDHFVSSLAVSSYEQFTDLISKGIISGLSAVESDSILTLLMNAICNFSLDGDPVESSFREVVSSVAYAHATVTGQKNEIELFTSSAANQAAAAILTKFSNLPPLHAMLARLALLRAFNRRVRLALPWLSIRPCQEGSAILGGLCGHGTSLDRSGRCQDSSQSNSWVQIPSIASKIRSLRGLIFTSVKRSFIQSVVDATTTPTSLSHDEYELPREIRTVRINRLKAARAMMGDDVSAKRKYSVFSQLQSETKNWGGASLRRGFVAKGHGGQKRAFKVKLIGEGVNDYSGPYREVFTDAMADVLKIEPNSTCSLAVLDPTPNNASSLGENRDLFMFSLNGRCLTSSKATALSCDPAEDRIRRTYASLMIGSDESSREVEESVAFLGRLVGTACRHGIPLDIPLPLYSVWKALVEEPVSSSQKLLELDHLAHKQLCLEDDANDSVLLAWQQRMLNAFSEGLGNVIPVEILPLLSGEELREMMCGNPNVDVDLLKQVVEYEGYGPTDDVITYFWSTLYEMTNEERKQFLQFVWARNRLPMRETDFDAPFKIQKDTSKGEEALPSASTCFFTLTLPEYTSQESLREKLLFAIRNVTTMETDFQTNSAEIAEGYRSF